MPLIKIGPLAQLPPGAATHFLAGEEAIAVCNVGGELYAMDGICPHSGGPLGHGALAGYFLACPFHAWEFDCRTGTSPVDEYLKLATYPVQVNNGDIYVDVSYVDVSLESQGA